MNIQQFQYVLAVVDSKNFENAADRCFVTQSTLSTMIGRFESEIGIKIFNRRTKPVSITPEGQHIISRLRIIQNEIEQLGNMVQELKDEMVGELRIGIISTIAPYLLPRFLPEFAKRFPKVKTIVKEIPTAQIQKDLKDRNLDVGILAIPIGDHELVEQELYTEPFLIYDCKEGNAKRKIAVTELDYSKLWLLQEGHCLRTQVYHICERSNLSPKNDLNFEFESGSMDSLLRFTKGNKGITILPYLAALDLPETDRSDLVAFESPVPVRSIGLLTHKDFVRKQLLQELNKVIRESVNGLIPDEGSIDVVNPLK
ncbi:hydrogen peroxide-inducible genes activator [Robertkochia solimangrovi]|uniref:hydrogen peroxide-inducible genes activator n=1 Tax=Robertkochia solimangrovi TaxID=2213046 RepID=UPI0011801781|nr:hydrogen peroxide-inducible genes activator [Robertkochia solimangrovi]TRZ40991.1 hydrogen peroxide-inducible genes activator [Robertkochia solimangrovi]